MYSTQYRDRRWECTVHSTQVGGGNVQYTVHRSVEGMYTTQYTGQWSLLPSLAVLENIKLMFPLRSSLHAHPIKYNPSSETLHPPPLNHRLPVCRSFALIAYRYGRQTLMINYAYLLKSFVSRCWSTKSIINMASNLLVTVFNNYCYLFYIISLFRSAQILIDGFSCLSILVAI